MLLLSGPQGRRTGLCTPLQVDHLLVPVTLETIADTMAEDIQMEEPKVGADVDASARTEAAAGDSTPPDDAVTEVATAMDAVHEVAGHDTPGGGVVDGDTEITEEVRCTFVPIL